MISQPRFGFGLSSDSYKKTQVRSTRHEPDRFPKIATALSESVHILAQNIILYSLLLPPYLFSFPICNVGTVHNMRQITNLHLIYKTKYSHE